MTAFTLGGLVSGAVHAVSGPDHLLSLAPLAVGRRRAAWRIGLLWGAGHAIGTAAAALALAVAVSATALPVAGAWGERVAGAALIALGLAGLLRRGRAAASSDAPPAASRGVVLVGLVHGVTGAAGLLLLAPAVLARSPVHALAYLGGFSVGSTAAMAALTASLAAASSRLARGATFPAAAARLASAGSIFLGGAWVVLAGA